MIGVFGILIAILAGALFGISAFAGAEVYKLILKPLIAGGKNKASAPSASTELATLEDRLARKRRRYPTISKWNTIPVGAVANFDGSTVQASVGSAGGASGGATTPFLGLSSTALVAPRHYVSSSPSADSSSAAIIQEEEGFDDDASIVARLLLVSRTLTLYAVDEADEYARREGLAERDRRWLSGVVAATEASAARRAAAEAYAAAPSTTSPAETTPQRLRLPSDVLVGRVTLSPAVLVTMRDAADGTHEVILERHTHQGADGTSIGHTSSAPASSRHRALPPRRGLFDPAPRAPNTNATSDSTVNIASVVPPEWHSCRFTFETLREACRWHDALYNATLPPSLTSNSSSSSVAAAAAVGNGYWADAVRAATDQHHQHSTAAAAADSNRSNANSPMVGALLTRMLSATVGPNGYSAPLTAALGRSLRAFVGRQQGRGAHHAADEEGTANAAEGAVAASETVVDGDDLLAFAAAESALEEAAGKASVAAFAKPMAAIDAICGLSPFTAAASEETVLMTSLLRVRTDAVVRRSASANNDGDDYNDDAVSLFANSTHEAERKNNGDASDDSFGRVGAALRLVDLRVGQLNGPKGGGGGGRNGQKSSLHRTLADIYHLGTLAEPCEKPYDDVSSDDEAEAGAAEARRPTRPAAPPIVVYDVAEAKEESKKPKNNSEDSIPIAAEGAAVATDDNNNITNTNTTNKNTIGNINTSTNATARRRNATAGAPFVCPATGEVTFDAFVSTADSNNPFVEALFQIFIHSGAPPAAATSRQIARSPPSDADDAASATSFGGGGGGGNGGPLSSAASVATHDQLESSHEEDAHVGTASMRRRKAGTASPAPAASVRVLPPLYAYVKVECLDARLRATVTAPPPTSAASSAGSSSGNAYADRAATPALWVGFCGRPAATVTCELLCPTEYRTFYEEAAEGNADAVRLAVKAMAAARPYKAAVEAAVSEGAYAALFAEVTLPHCAPLPLPLMSPFAGDALPTVSSAASSSSSSSSPALSAALGLRGQRIVAEWERHSAALLDAAAEAHLAAHRQRCEEAFAEAAHSVRHYHSNNSTAAHPFAIRHIPPPSAPYAAYAAASAAHSVVAPNGGDEASAYRGVRHHSPAARGPAQQQHQQSIIIGASQSLTSPTVDADTSAVVIPPPPHAVAASQSQHSAARDLVVPWLNTQSLSAAANANASGGSYASASVPAPIPVSNSNNLSARGGAAPVTTPLRRLFQRAPSAANSRQGSAARREGEAIEASAPSLLPPATPLRPAYNPLPLPSHPHHATSTTTPLSDANNNGSDRQHTYSVGAVGAPAVGASASSTTVPVVVEGAASPAAALELSAFRRREEQLRAALAEARAAAAAAHEQRLADEARNDRRREEEAQRAKERLAELEKRMAEEKEREARRRLHDDMARQAAEERRRQREEEAALAEALRRREAAESDTAARINNTEKAIALLSETIQKIADNNANNGSNGGGRHRNTLSPSASRGSRSQLFSGSSSAIIRSYTPARRHSRRPTSRRRGSRRSPSVSASSLPSPFHSDDDDKEEWAEEEEASHTDGDASAMAKRRVVKGTASNSRSGTPRASRGAKHQAAVAAAAEEAKAKAAAEESKAKAAAAEAAAAAAAEKAQKEREEREKEREAAAERRAAAEAERLTALRDQLDADRRALAAERSAEAAAAAQQSAALRSTIAELETRLVRSSEEAARRAAADESERRAREEALVAQIAQMKGEQNELMLRASAAAAASDSAAEAKLRATEAELAALREALAAEKAAAEVRQAAAAAETAAALKAEGDARRLAEAQRSLEEMKVKAAAAEVEAAERQRQEEAAKAAEREEKERAAARLAEAEDAIISLQAQIINSARAPTPTNGLLSSGAEAADASSSRGPSAPRRYGSRVAATGRYISPSASARPNRSPAGAVGGFDVLHSPPPMHPLTPRRGRGAAAASAAPLLPNAATVAEEDSDSDFEYQPRAFTGSRPRPGRGDSVTATTDNNSNNKEEGADTNSPPLSEAQLVRALAEGLLQGAELGDDLMVVKGASSAVADADGAAAEGADGTEGAGESPTTTASASLKEGDLLLCIGETTLHSLKQLHEAMAKAAAGDVIDISVFRGGELVDLRLVVRR